MKLQRRHYLWVALLLLVGLWWGWPESPKDDPHTGGSHGAASSGSPVRGSKTIPPMDPQSAGRRSASRDREPSTPDASARLERILANDGISIPAAAVMLHDMAVDSSLPVEVRLDALAHGLNLDITPFARFAETPGLPAALAAEFLEEVMNCNESPELQIHCYMALLNHPDPEVSEDAAETLAFLMEDDLGEDDKPTLLQKAQRKLKDLAKPRGNP